MQNQSDLNQLIARIFLIVGKLEGYSYLILLFIAMPLKYIFKMPKYVLMAGTLHGILFVGFIFLLAVMFFKVKLSFKNSFFCFLLSLIPFGTFYLKKLLN